MRTAAEILNICRIGRGGAGLLSVGPGLLVRRFAGLFVERDDALARLRYMRAGAEVLQIRRICCDGAGLLSVGPGPLVGILARLLIGRLLLLRRLLRVRGLAASGNEGRARDGSDKCPFSKRNASGGLRLSRRITVHGCSSLVAPAHPPACNVLLIYVPKLRRGQRRTVQPTHTSRYRLTLELNCQARTQRYSSQQRVMRQGTFPPPSAPE